MKAIISTSKKRAAHILACEIFKNVDRYCTSDGYQHLESWRQEEKIHTMRSILLTRAYVKFKLYGNGHIAVSTVVHGKQWNSGYSLQYGAALPGNLSMSAQSACWDSEIREITAVRPYVACVLLSLLWYKLINVDINTKYWGWVEKMSLQPRSMDNSDFYNLHSCFMTTWLNLFISWLFHRHFMYRLIETSPSR